MDVPRLLRPLSRVPRSAIFGLALTGLLLQAFGLYWDIWRHVVVGRESFFTPPHLVLYAGFGYVALAGIVGSVSGAIAPRWAGPRVHIVGLSVPVEFLLIGTGALFQAVASRGTKRGTASWPKASSRRPSGVRPTSWRSRAESSARSGSFSRWCWSGRDGTGRGPP